MPPSSKSTTPPDAGEFQKEWLQKVGSTGKHPAMGIRNAPDMDTSEKRFEL